MIAAFFAWIWRKDVQEFDHEWDHLYDDQGY